MIYLPEQFEVLCEEFADHEVHLLAWKRNEYASGGDRLQNFREVAGLSGEKMSEVALIQQLYLTEEFINSKFRMARFKLFNVLVNGGIEECCETVYNGVPYSNLNNGARLNIGLDIINTLAEHYGFAPPAWLDNAESVTDILPTKGQRIRLIVSAQDKKLRIELEEREVLKEVV